MTLQTYRLVVAETASHEGVTADVYGPDDAIVETTRLEYDDLGLVAAREGEEESPEWVSTVEADVTTTDLAIHRRDAGFDVVLSGDGEELLRERVEHSDLEVTSSPP